MDKSLGKVPPGEVKVGSGRSHLIYWTDEGPDDGSEGALVPRGTKPSPPSLTMEAEAPDSTPGLIE